MDTAVPVDEDLAHDQWAGLVRLIQGAGAKVETIDPVDDLPDMVFTANAGMVNGNDFVSADMRHPEQRDEVKFFRAWFSDHGFQVIDQRRGAVQEGAGDALPFSATLLTGHGQRSTEASCYALASDNGLRILPVRLVDPRYYHLDLAFCPLDGRSAMIAPGALSPAGRRAIAELVPAPVVLTADETAMFCANSLVIGRTVIMPACTARLGRQLEERGFEVAIANVSEFVKGGGACRCLTLALDVVLPRAR